MIAPRPARWNLSDRRAHQRPRATARGLLLHRPANSSTKLARYSDREHHADRLCSRCAQKRQVSRVFFSNLVDALRSILVAENFLKADERTARKCVWPSIVCAHHVLVMRDGIIALRHCKKDSWLHSPSAVNPPCPVLLRPAPAQDRRASIRANGQTSYLVLIGAPLQSTPPVNG